MTTKAKQDPPDEVGELVDNSTPTEKLQRDIRANIGSINKDLEHFKKLEDPTSQVVYAKLVQAKSNFYLALATIETKVYTS